MVATPLSASQIHLTAPASATPGRTVDIKAAALDFFGDLATAYAGAMEFSRRDGVTDLAAGPVMVVDGSGQFRGEWSANARSFLAECCQAIAC